MVSIEIGMLASSLVQKRINCMSYAVRIKCMGSIYSLDACSHSHTESAMTIIRKRRDDKANA